MRFLAVIPARFNSSRFPGKPLATIAEKPMLQHVYEKVSQSLLFDEVIIATDDERIFSAAKNFEAKVMMTSTHHENGTERCAEVVRNLQEHFDVVVNVQGDEPFITKEALSLLINLFKENEKAEIGTLITKLRSEEELLSSNTAKVVLNIHKEVLYFSRSPIPFVRDVAKNEWVGQHNFWKHIGIYGFRSEILLKLVTLAESSLEKVEKLEQLRWLENGFKIYTSETQWESLAVDTIEDLQKARDHYNKLVTTLVENNNH